MNRRLFTKLASFLTLLALAGCGESRFSYRYRLTLEVETPEGVKSGSGVLEVNAFDTKNAFPKLAERRSGALVKGEAIAVDLGSRGILFVLLTSPRSLEAAAFLPAFAATRAGIIRQRYDYDLYTDLARDLAKIKTPIDVSPGEIPLLVRFRDINDPATVERVDPANFAASFGPSVKLVRATIEITNDPVTTSIEKRLWWLRHVANERATLIPNPPRLLKDTTPVQLVAPSNFTTSNLGEFK
ncbi:hypothetical protein M2322_004776 [Rhodoblastus acidophilus]|uniref:hypothetical protein n=1 Tax=Rhodoblastus acidophilus TaxID=1074 RepID=UPI0022244175|nr:hypothetical protein [Rhodoblastus acidophilus]MCW2319207.1 hypothetical protein [Rhodoblastus acidophilus]